MIVTGAHSMAAAETPWRSDWSRFMRLAQSGTSLAEEAEAVPLTAFASGDTAAEPAARATPPSPEATPAMPDWPAAPML